ncbi:MAG: metal-dependent hydrolase [Sedimentisphaerales bacterium]|nr:metal-dependent hydrolase [Sedimentisphaerales bacterium]
MTTIGHTLTGLTLGVLALPRGLSRWGRLAYFASFIVLANVPDIRLPYWGHQRYAISHSVFTNLALMGLAVVLVRIFGRQKLWSKWPVIIAGCGAWLSHLLLDSFYNHGRGIAMFWPFSSARLVLPLPWFSNLHDIPPLFTPEHWRIFGTEFAFYGIFLLAAIIIRYAARNQ